MDKKDYIKEGIIKNANKESEVLESLNSEASFSLNDDFTELKQDDEFYSVYTSDLDSKNKSGDLIYGENKNINGDILGINNKTGGLFNEADNNNFNTDEVNKKNDISVNKGLKQEIVEQSVIDKTISKEVDFKEENFNKEDFKGEGFTEEDKYPSNKHLNSDNKFVSFESDFYNNDYVSYTEFPSTPAAPEDNIKIKSDILGIYDNSDDSLKKDNIKSDRKENNALKEATGKNLAEVGTIEKEAEKGADKKETKEGIEQNESDFTGEEASAIEGSYDNDYLYKQQKTRTKSVILGIGDKSQVSDDKINDMTYDIEDITGCRKEYIRDYVSEIKKEKNEEDYLRYRDIDRETTVEGTASAAAGDARGFTVATVKKGVNKAGHVAKKGIDAATEAISSPEMMIKSYSKAKTKKEQIENIDVSGMAKDTFTFFGHKILKLLKLIFKYIRVMFATGLISVFIIGLFFWSAIFFIAAEIDSDDTEASSEEVIEETEEINAIYTYVGNWVYINQGDYSNVSMGGGQSVKRSGCGLTCLASVLATYTGNTSITPATVVNYANIHGTPKLSSGVIAMSDSLCSGMCLEYGVTYKYLTKSADEIESVLNSGGCVIVWMSSSSKWTDGTFVTSNRHYILLMGYSSDGVIACMNSAGGRLCYILESTVVSDGATTNMYAFWRSETLENMEVSGDTDN